MGGITFVRGITAIPQEHEIGFTCNGNGAAVTTGEKVSIAVPYSGYIESWSMMADVPGSAVIDIWKSPAPVFPTVTESICGFSKPFLGDYIQYAESGEETSTLDDWNRTINEDDILTFNIDSVDGTITRLVLILRIL